MGCCALIALVAAQASPAAAARLLRPGTRVVLAAVIGFELLATGLWLQAAHGRHLAEWADMSWAAVRGRQVYYVGLCSSREEARARLEIPN